MSADRYRYLDALRGLAIILVMVNHLGAALELGGMARALTNACAYGVQLFFVVSAVTIFMTYRRTEGRPGALRDFYFRRLFRIVPVYWFALALYAAVYGAQSRGWGPAPAGLDVLWNALLVNALVPGASNSLVPGGWSISVEVLFYLTAPLWFRWLTSARSALLAAGVFALLGPLSVRLLKTLGGPSGLDAAEWQFFMYCNPINQFACFAIGAALYYHLVGGGRSVPASALRGPWRAEAAAALCLLALLVVALVKPRFPATHHLLALGFAGLAWLLASHELPALVNRFTLFWGRVSFSAYLFHFLVIEIVSGLVPFESPARGFWVCSLVLAATAGCAHFSQRWIESTSVRLGRAVSYATALRLGSSV